MTISFVGDGGYNFANSATSATFAYSNPAGTAVGDLLVILASSRSDSTTPTVTTPAGCTYVANTGVGDSTVAKSNLYAFWRVADSSDVGGTISITANGPGGTFTYVEAAIRGYRGTATTSPVNGFSTVVDPTSNNTTTLPAVTNEAAFISGEWYVAIATSDGTNVPSSAAPVLSHVNSDNAISGFYRGDLIPAVMAPTAEAFAYLSFGNGRLALGLTIKPFASVGATVILQSQICL